MDSYVNMISLLQFKEISINNGTKHNLFSDSLTNAGVICSYWENEQPLTRKQLMNQNSKLKDSDFPRGQLVMNQN